MGVIIFPLADNRCYKGKVVNLLTTNVHALHYDSKISTRMYPSFNIRMYYYYTNLTHY